MTRRRDILRFSVLDRIPSLRCRHLPAIVATILLGATPLSAQTIQTPTDFFGFAMGTDGELARYPQVLEYMRHLAEESDRVLYQDRGTTTNGHPYVLVTFSSEANLDRLNRLIEINHRLADPRGLAETDAQVLVQEGVPFYFLYATIHSNEVGNGQAIIEVAHRLATEDSPEIQEILDNTVLLMVPSQNPDGQVLVVDHWYKTRGTGYQRSYPDLYHRYTGHDDNRDWFMFTQKETRLAIDIHRQYKPQVTHDMHQMGPDGARIFVPPFQDPYDPNIHPILIKGQEQIGMAMASALTAAGKQGVIYNDQYDLWSPARQYMLYHGQPRILTEIASVRLADPYYNPAGIGQPLGPQQPRWNFPVPYEDGVWRLADIVEYGRIAVFAGLEQMAKYRIRWLENFYRVHKDWVDRDEPPYAFVVPAEQRDPYETFELLDVLHFGEVEIHRARSPFSADGRAYSAGSWVILLAQPYGAFAKTMLERQVYPDLRYYQGGPPIPPYDVTGHTLGLLMGVDVRQIASPVRADLELLNEIVPLRTPLPSRPGWAYAIGPSSNAGFLAVTQLQAAGVPVFRAADSFGVPGGSRFEAGTWIVPPTPDAERVLERVAYETGLVVSSTDHAPEVGAYRLKTPTRVGLWRVANNMPGGWMLWLFEQYGLDHRVVSALDFQKNLANTYDVIVLPEGTTRSRMINGLNPRHHDESWRWAYGIGERGWKQLRQWVLDGGTLVALGSAVSAARELLDLPIEPVLPESGGRRPSAGPPQSTVQVPASEVTRRLRNAFQSPEQLAITLRDVVDPTSVFYGPGALLKQEHNPSHPVGYGMPSTWPIFFRLDQAYRLTPSFDINAEVVSRYPDESEITVSGWLLGEELLRNQANVVSFAVGQGRVVTIGSQATFRAQTRATFKLLFNAIFHGPATELDAEQLATLN